MTTHYKVPSVARLRSLAAIAAVLAGLPLAAVAATDAPPTNGRFSMAPVDGGFLRMDTDNGVVSLCAKKVGEWRCETVPDDYQALQKENEALKKQLAEIQRGDGSATPGKPEAKRDWPTDEEIDKGFEKIDKYLRKFRELIEKHQGPDTPGRT